MSKQAVQPPIGTLATEPRYSLLFVASELTDGERWQQGVRWAPEDVGGGGVLSIDCSGSTAEMEEGDHVPETEADPFVVWAEDHCSTVGSLKRDYEARARRNLAGTQSFHVAREFWAGALAQADSLDNHWLAEDPAIVGAGALDPVEALATIDEALGHMLTGRRGMIHCSLGMLDRLHRENLLELNGQKYLTAAGTLVVADAGYPGTEPTAGDADAHQWLYATGLVSYRLGAVMITPEVGDARGIAAATDRATNLTTVFAQREVLLQWDSEVPIGSTGKTGVLAAETTVPAFTTF